MINRIESRKLSLPNHDHAPTVGNTKHKMLSDNWDSNPKS